MEWFTERDAHLIVDVVAGGLLLRVALCLLVGLGQTVRHCSLRSHGCRHQPPAAEP